MFRPPLLPLLLSGCLGLHAQALLAANVSNTDKLVQQWLSLEQQSAALEQQWQQTEPLLQQRLQLLRAEKKQLQSLLAHKQQDAGSVEEKRAQLLETQNQLEQDQAKTQKQLAVLTQALAALQPQLPPPLAQQWQKEQGALNKTESSNQLQVALAQLSQLLEFNQRISVNEDTLKAPEGQQVVVKQLFLGASYAWFASQDGSFSGTGRNIDGRWQWSFNNTLPSQAILDAIAMFEKRREADFIQLPIVLSATEPEGAAQ